MPVNCEHLKPLFKGHSGSRSVVAASRTVGGVLFAAEAARWPSIYAAYLGNVIRGSLGGPPVSLFGLAPSGVCQAARVTPDAGALLPHRFTLTCAPGEAGAIGGLFSVALSCESPRLAVSQHPALWSPDLPRPGRLPRNRRAAATRPARRRRSIARFASHPTDAVRSRWPKVRGSIPGPARMPLATAAGSDAVSGRRSPAATR